MRARQPGLDGSPEMALGRSLRVRNQVDSADLPSGTYDAGGQTRRTIGWRAPTTTPNTAILNNLTTLRDRSRAATRNDGYARNAIDLKVSNLVGTGVTPLSQADDPAFRRFVMAKWLEWTDESDADGLLDLYGQQSQAVRTWKEAGEAFVRLRPRLPSDGLSVPLQIQVFDPELCPHTHTARARNGNRIRAGIEFNSIGRRVGYWFHPSRSNEPDDIDFNVLKFVPADRVIHLFNPLRPGQLRGTPDLTQALNKFWELDKFDDATLLKQQLGNLVVAYIKRPASLEGGEDVDPITGLALTGSAERPTITMEPGTYQQLDPGEEIEFSKPPDVGSTYPDFMRVQLYGAAASAGVPYELLSGDLSRINDRTVRVILQEFRRRVQVEQHQIFSFQFCRAVWRAWMDRGFLSGALPIPIEYVENPMPWARVKWMPQGWPYIHPVQDQQAAREGIRDGTTSRAAVVAERGEDIEEIDAAQKAEHDRIDPMGLKYDSDGRNAKGSAAPAPAPEPELEPAAGATK